MPLTRRQREILDYISGHIDGKGYALSEDGTVHVFAAAPKFELVAKNSTGEPVLATPAVANGRLYVRGQKHLFCIGGK